MDFGCTSFSWNTKNNLHLLGRTYDQFGNLDGNNLVIVPKNYKMNLLAQSQNYVYTKYSFVGMNIKGLETPLMTDGINEKGLMGALLRFPGFACYDTNTFKGAIEVNPAFLVTYLLSECSSVDEVCDKMSNINLIDEKIFDGGIPVHYIFSDRTGETVIIEPEKEGVKIYRKTIGVLTNAPDFKWQEQNLRNYVLVDPSPKSSLGICGQIFTDFGFTGIDFPGSYSSVDRFVRIALLKEFSVVGEDEIDGVTRMFRNFSSVTVPAGVMSMKLENGSYDYQSTLCIVSMCSESLKYYFNLSTNDRISVIDLNKSLNNKEIEYIELPRKQDVLYLN